MASSNENNRFEKTINGNWRIGTVCNGSGAIVVSFDGTMIVLPSLNVQIEVSIDRAIQMTNYKNNVALAINSKSTFVSFIHPMTFVNYYNEDRVDILLNDGNNRYTKFIRIRQNEIIVSGKGEKLTYKLNGEIIEITRVGQFDFAGIIPKQVFYSSSQHGPSFIPQCKKIFQSGKYTMTRYGCQSWLFNNIKIAKRPKETTQILLNNREIDMKLDSKGTASIKMPGFECCASIGKRNHAYIKFGLCSVFYNGKIIRIICVNQKITYNMINKSYAIKNNQHY